MFDLWEKEGRQQISHNFEIFNQLKSRSREFLVQNQYAMSAVYAEMAASYACGKHCGLFISSELESILASISKQTVKQNEPTGKDFLHNKPFKKVLHVATEMKAIGGHSRMLWRWIQQDSERSHSLVLTRQSPSIVPALLKDAVINSGGEVSILNTQVGGLIEWAEHLRKVANNVDIVILHVHNYDTVPLLAFAQKENLPPIVLLDHADHLFWLGARIADVVISLRESGMRIAQSRRYIESNRSVLLPIILEPTMREFTRAEAKRQLNLPEDCLLLLSIARSLKYRTINSVTFADLHLPLLKRFKEAILVVVGPGNPEDWLSAIKQTEGRIKVFHETENTALFYQAADIYVDSFPFVSNTSLLEAGSYGTPLVSQYPYSSDASGILGADMPGLTGNLMRAKNNEEYIIILSKLIEDTEFRNLTGEKTKYKINNTHKGDGWTSILDNVYSFIHNTPQKIFMEEKLDQSLPAEPDVYMHQVHNIDINENQLIKWHLPLMPFQYRIKNWLMLVKKTGFSHNPPNLLLPEWFRAQYYVWRRSLKFR